MRRREPFHDPRRGAENISTGQSLRAIEEDYYEEDPISNEIYALVDESQDYYQKGEPDNAIAILEAIISACIEEWDNLEDYGAVNDDLSARIDRVLTGAILSKEFNPQEKQDLREKMEQWINPSFFREYARYSPISRAICQPLSVVM